MSKYSGAHYRNMIETFKNRLETMPTLSGIVEGKMAYFKYTIGKHKYYVTAYDSKSNQIEGLTENGRDFPAYFSLSFESLLKALRAELDLNFEPMIPLV
jgi:hypothetical protein